MTHWVEANADAGGKVRVKLTTLCSCRDWCGVTRANPSGDMAARARNRCALPGFDPSEWTNPPDREAAMWGDEVAGLLARRLDLDYNFDRDGCPNAWAHSRYANEVARYMGQRDRDSATRIPSIRMQRRMLRDEVEPAALLEDVERAEAYQDNALRLYWEMQRK